MSFIVEEALERYAEEHTTPMPELFERLAAETRSSTTAPQMMDGPLEGRFLGWLVRLSGAKQILEIGTFTGYSSIAMALSLPDDGRITSLDVSHETTEVARRYAIEAGVVDLIEFQVGPALDALDRLDGPFDLVFIDADKENYLAYYEAALPLLAPNGVIAVDNVLWSGRVLDPRAESDRAIVAFNDHVQRDPRVTNVILTVRDGLMLIRRADRG